jgi:hypothetical protein
MVALRALLYALAVFAALALISLIVAGIMKIMYAILHKGEKKVEPENKVESSTVS